MVSTIFLSACSLLVCALVAVDVVSWRRTRAIRSGERGASVEGVSMLRSSWTTLLAASSGLAAAGAGVARSPPTPASLALGAAGTLIAVSGIRARVTALEIDETGVTIRYAHRRAYSISWKGCRGLVPPRWPLGGWRLRAQDRGRTLMPSDVLGNEAVLGRLVHESGLSFDGTEWRASLTEEHGSPDNPA